MRILKSGSFEDLFKFADVRPTPEEMAAIRGEGGYMITDPDIAETNVMQGAKDRKTDIKGAVGRLTLPRIVYPTTSDIVELDGHQYYVVSIAKPQPKKNPEGTIYLLNLENGEPERKPFMQYADRLNSVKREKIMGSLKQINDMITRWNFKIENIEASSSPTTWKGQLFRAKAIVDERMSELERQEQAKTAELDSSTNFPPAYSGMMGRMKDDILQGRITDHNDLVDHVMFIHSHDPDAIEEMLQSPNIPEQMKSNIRRLIGIGEEEAQKKQTKRTTDEEERQDRVEAEMEGDVLEPGELPMMELEDKDVESFRWSPVVDKYFGPKGKTQSIRATLIGIRQNKDALTKVKTALDGLVTYIDGLAQGERAKNLLMNTERGNEIKREIAEFMHESESFLRRYKTKVFVPNAATGKTSLNPALLGSSGGVGNAKVMIALNQMWSVIRASLKAHAAPASQQEPVENAQDYAMLPQDVPTA